MYTETVDPKPVGGVWVTDTDDADEPVTNATGDAGSDPRLTIVVPVEPLPTLRATVVHIVEAVVEGSEADGDVPRRSREGTPRPSLVLYRVPPALLAMFLVAVALGFGGYALFKWFDPVLMEVFA